MNHAPANPAVLANLYLSAVLPCLADLTDQDPIARDMLGDLQASIVLRVCNGPAVTVRFARGKAVWENGAAHAPSVILLFVSNGHLNAFFSGKKWAVPVLLWGGWHIGALARFSKLAQRLEAILDGHPEVIETAAGRRGGTPQPAA